MRANQRSALKVLLAAVLLAIAGSATAAIVYTDQEEYVLNPLSGTATIDVLVDTQGENLSSWAILSAVDPLVVTIGNPQVNDIWSGVSESDGQAGEAGALGISFFGDGPEGPDILLYQVSFKALFPGETELLQSAVPGIWRNQDGDPIDVTFVNPVIRVVPVPAAVWLFGSGLLGLIGIARRKKAA